MEESREQHKTRAVHEGIRKIIGKHASQVKSIKDDQGKILTDPAAVKERREDYFDKLYNDPNEVQEDALQTLPESSNTEDIPEIGEDEVKQGTRNRQHHSGGTERGDARNMAADVAQTVWAGVGERSATNRLKTLGHHTNPQEERPTGLLQLQRNQPPVPLQQSVLFHLIAKITEKNRLDSLRGTSRISGEQEYD